jgi:hypothetical protein
VTQPSWQQNLDRVGSQNWRGGAGVSSSYTGAIFTAPVYSATGGPAEQDYSPTFTRISNDVGQVS